MPSASTPDKARQETAWLKNDPDQRDGRVYVASPDLLLAVEVALAAGRPLLIRGEPGSGKSSLAPYIARTKNWRYYEHVVTSTTQATDLLWTFDSVRRLAAAQTLQDGQVLDDFSYVEPGVLWWAFAPESAARRGAPLTAGGQGTGQATAPRPPAREPASAPMEELNQTRSADHAVVLIDEIDKADPDMPNSLLVPLGSSEFTVSETRTPVRKEPAQGKTANDAPSRHLIIVTTNEERALPQAFLRRCVTLTLPPPSAEWLVSVAREHVSRSGESFTADTESLAWALAEELMKARVAAMRQVVRPPSTAEFLDALRACVGLGVTVDSPQWPLIRELTLIKQQHPGLDQ